MQQDIQLTPTPLTPSTPTASHGKMKQIGAYQYDERHCLGEGAYGKVYQGLNTETEEVVAIKKLDLVMFEKDQYLKNQIVTEIEILKKFNHTNIVRFIDLILTQRSLYIVTEYCKDGDLKQVLSKKRYTEPEVIAIMTQIVSGFKELVKMGVIHRDLKPANILNHEGVVKIADFGFARYVDNYTSQLLRSCVGSPLYMAPQVLSRKPYSTKCDVWSIGVIFYEMMFHEVPWKGMDEQDLLRNIRTRPLTFKEDIPCSAFSKHFLSKALSVEEGERFTWDEVFALLGAGDDSQQTISFDEGEQETAVQKIPWMDIQSKLQPIPAEHLQKQLLMFVKERQEIAFRHFVCHELKTRVELIRGYCKSDLAVEDVICSLARSVVCVSLALLRNISDTCDQGDALLQKGTKWNILARMRKEHDFYEMFYNDYRDELDRANKTIPTADEDLRLDVKLLKCANDLNEEFKRRINDLGHMREYFNNIYLCRSYEVGIQAEYLVDLVMMRQMAHQDVDYELLMAEKSQHEDLRRLSQRITQKIKQTSQ